MSSEDTTQKLPRAIVDLDERVSTLETKFDDRGYDTRPMFKAHDEQIKQLQEQVKRLEEKLATGQPGELIYRDWAYFTESGDGPFCRTCYDDKQKRCRLEPQADPAQHFCTICKQWSYELGTRPKDQVLSARARHPYDAY